MSTPKKALEQVTAKLTLEMGANPTFTVNFPVSEAQALGKLGLQGSIDLAWNADSISLAMPNPGKKRNKPIAFGVYKDVSVGVIYTATKDGKPPRWRWLEIGADGKKHRRSRYTKSEAVALATAEAKRIWKMRHGGKAAALSAESGELCALATQAKSIAGPIGIHPLRLLSDAAGANEVLTVIYPDKNTRPTLTEAAKELGRKVLEMREQKRLTFGEVMTEITRRLREKGKMKNGTQGRRFKSVGDRFAKKHGSRYMSDIRFTEIEQWFAEELGESVTYYTAKQYLSALRIIFAFARKTMRALPPQDKLTTAHLAEIDPEDHRPDGKNKIEAYTTAEKRKILEAADNSLEYSDWTHVMALLFDTGVHFQELVRLRFSDIVIGPDRSILTISKDAARRHKSRLPHLSPATVTWIIDKKEEAEAEGEPNRWIIPGVEGETIDDADQCYGKVYAEFCDARTSILADANVKSKRNGFRRAFGTHLMAIIWNLQVTADFMGSDPINLAPYYLDAVQQAELAQTKAAAEYFQVGRPGCGDFSRLHPHEWLPEEVFRSQAQARADINSAIAQLKNTYKKRGI
jgi:integrase